MNAIMDLSIQRTLDLHFFISKAMKAKILEIVSGGEQSHLLLVFFCLLSVHPLMKPNIVSTTLEFGAKPMQTKYDLFLASLTRLQVTLNKVREVVTWLCGGQVLHLEKADVQMPWARSLPGKSEERQEASAAGVGRPRGSRERG